MRKPQPYYSRPSFALNAHLSGRRRSASDRIHGTIIYYDNYRKIYVHSPVDPTYQSGAFYLDRSSIIFAFVPVVPTPNAFENYIIMLICRYGSTSLPAPINLPGVQTPRNNFSPERLSQIGQKEPFVFYFSDDIAGGYRPVVLGRLFPMHLCPTDRFKWCAFKVQWLIKEHTWKQGDLILDNDCYRQYIRT